MSSNTVHVGNISHSTTESDLSSFFSFCGKITSLSVTPTSADPSAPKSATVTFERPSAAKTAVLLDGTALNDAPLSVTPAHSLDDLAAPPTASGEGEIPQEDKPRSAIFAEYLSHGYELGDEILRRGIEFDNQQGLSARFSAYLASVLHTLDEKTHAVDRAKAADSQYHFVQRAEGARGMLARYFERALGTGPGQRVRTFYDQSEKHISEIHAEAKRLADLRKEKKRATHELGSTGTGTGDSTAQQLQSTCNCGGDEAACGCAEGNCACAGCKKNEKHAVEDIKGTASEKA